MLLKGMRVKRPPDAKASSRVVDQAYFCFVLFFVGTHFGFLVGARGWTACCSRRRGDG